MDAASSNEGEIDVELLASDRLTVEERVNRDGSLTVEKVAYQGPRRDLRDAAGRSIGGFYLVPTGGSELEVEFLGSVDRWLWIGVALAGAVVFERFYRTDPSRQLAHAPSPDAFWLFPGSALRGRFERAPARPASRGKRPARGKG